MRILLNIVAILILVAVIFLAVLNAQTMLTLTFWAGVKTSSITYIMSLVNLIVLIMILGMLAGGLLTASFYQSTQTKLKEYQRKLEKTSVQSSEGSSKVEVLEAKIQVLEKALQSALNKNN